MGIINNRHLILGIDENKIIGPRWGGKAQGGMKPTKPHI